MKPRAVVVGGGLAGSSVAWHLAREWSVTLLEQGEGLGAEASAQNAGMARRLVRDPVERYLARRSLSGLRALLSEGRPEWVERPPFRRNGGVVAVRRPDPGLAEAVADLRAQGVPVEDLSPTAWPAALRTGDYAAVWRIPDDGVLDAWSLVTGFVAGARALGATVRTRAAVQRLRITQGRVTGVFLADGALEADVVVLATGAWSAALAAGCGLHRPLVPLARHLLQTAPHAAFRSDHPWVWVEDGGVYARPEAGGWLISPCDERAVEIPRGPGSRGPVDPFARASAVSRLATSLPDLADVRFVSGWTGLRTFAPDRRPLLGPDPDLPGLAWATALGGAGVTCALSVGEIVAESVAGIRQPGFDLSVVSPGRAFASEFPEIAHDRA